MGKYEGNIYLSFLLYRVHGHFDFILTNLYFYSSFFFFNFFSQEAFALYLLTSTFFNWTGMYHVLCSKSEEENAFPRETNRLNFRLTRDMVVYREKFVRTLPPGIASSGNMSILTEIRQQKQRNAIFFV